MKKSLFVALSLVGMLCLGAGSNETASMRSGTLDYEITFTNITHGVILTPPIFAMSRTPINVFEAGEPASLSLEKLAEGGMTDDLRTEWESGVIQDLIQTSQPLLPGQSITVELQGSRLSRLSLASMLLPTNDGFVAMNGERVWKLGGRATFFLNAYDAGTELNDETCASIPGPICGGEGFNAVGGEGFVVPHAGIHGEGELSRRAYNWGDPVAKVTVRPIP